MKDYGVVYSSTNLNFKVRADISELNTTTKDLLCDPERKLDVFAALTRQGQFEPNIMVRSGNYFKEKDIINAFASCKEKNFSNLALDHNLKVIAYSNDSKKWTPTKYALDNMEKVSLDHLIDLTTKNKTPMLWSDKETLFSINPYDVLDLLLAAIMKDKLFEAYLPTFERRSFGTPSKEGMYFVCKYFMSTLFNNSSFTTAGFNSKYEKLLSREGTELISTIEFGPVLEKFNTEKLSEEFDSFISMKLGMKDKEEDTKHIIHIKDKNDDRLEVDDRIYLLSDLTKDKGNFVDGKENEELILDIDIEFDGIVLLNNTIERAIVEEGILNIFVDKNCTLNTNELNFLEDRILKEYKTQASIYVYERE